MPFKVESQFTSPCDSKAELMFRLIIILGLEVQPYNGDKIGNPTNLEQANTSAAAAAPAPNAAPAANRAQPARPAGGAAGGRSGKDMGPIFPIEGLSPYQNK